MAERGRPISWATREVYENMDLQALLMTAMQILNFALAELRKRNRIAEAADKLPTAPK